MTRRTLNAGPPPAAERVDLVVHYMSGGAPKSETFTITSDPGLGGVISWRAARDKYPLVAAMLRPLMVDDDGLSVAYQGVSGGKATGAENPAYDARIADPEQWSSARRWAVLSASGHAVISAGQLVDVIEQLVTEATGGRPTDGSALSSTGRGRTKPA